MAREAYIGLTCGLHRTFPSLAVLAVHPRDYDKAKADARRAVHDIAKTGGPCGAWLCIREDMSVAQPGIGIAMTRDNVPLHVVALHA